MSGRPHPVRPAPGYTLVEVLVTIVILAFGLLHLAALHNRVSIAEVESYQRTQALLLLQEMTDRMEANASSIRADINNGTSLNNYVQNDIGTGGLQNCTSLSGAALDRCEWANALIGAGEKTSSSINIGTLTGGRGCISQPITGDPYTFLVVVTWQGQIKTTAPPTSLACGTGAYGDEASRRAIGQTLRIAPLV